MKLVPLKQWICDSCGGIIEKPDDGWLEWYEDRNTYLQAGFRIVHHGHASPRNPHSKCQYDGKQLYSQNKMLLDNKLVDFLGLDGLGVLISMIETRKFADIKEIVYIVRRLHFPYYEEARQYWDDAKRDGFFDGANEYWPFLKRTLQAIIKRYEEN